MIAVKIPIGVQQEKIDLACSLVRLVIKITI